MKAWTILSLLLSWLALTTAGNARKYLYEGKEENKAVIEYKDGVDFVSSSAPKIVVFYSPFCGHCIHYAPKYMSIAEEVTALYPSVEFYAVSCKAHGDVCKQHEIRGYPTVHAFPEGEETSSVVSARNSKEGFIDALKLGAALDRKLVDGETASDKQEEDSDQDETDDEATGNDSNAEDSDDEDDAQGDTDEDEATAKGDDPDEDDEDTDENETGNAKLRAKGGGLDSNKASTNADDATGDVDSEGDTEEDDEDETEEDDKNNDSESEGIGGPGAEDDSDEQENDSDEEDPDDSNPSDEESDENTDEDNVGGPGEDDSDEPDVELDMIKMAPPEVDTDEESPDDEDDSDEDDEDGPEDSNPSDEEDADDSDNETDEDSEDDESETEEGGPGERWEEDSPEVLDRVADAPRGGKDISEAVMAYREANKNGRRPGAGALKSKTQARDMDKWKELIAKKKAEFEKRRGRAIRRGKTSKNAQQQQDKEGATNVMKANTPGTSQYKERVELLLKKINKLRKKRGLAPMTSPLIATKKSAMPLKKEVKKPGIIRRQGEKVPIVKRIFKMTQEEELILDASLSFVAGLKYGVFMSSDILTAKQQAALKGWLDLMSVSLPPEWGLHSLIDELNDNIDMVSQSNENLLRILRKHPLPRREWSPSCTKNDSPQGFSCGMWKLLHTSTVGIAEQRGGLNLVESNAVDPDTRTFSPADAADTMREYIAFFFGCRECRDHFIAQYDQCSFRRCIRLTDDIEMATPEDWKQLALWLWEVHNDVSVRVAHERIERQMESVKTSRYRMARLKREDEIKHLYPSLEQCLQCFYDNGSFDEANVFEFLEETYWSGPDVTADKLLQYRGEEGSGSGFIWFFVVIVLAAVYFFRGRKTEGLARTMNAAVVKGRQIGGKKRSA